MDDSTRRAQLERHWTGDIEVQHEIYHEDAVLEFPQSGERFEGLAKFKAWRSIYPAAVRFRIRKLRGGGDFWVAENSISYDGGPWQFTVSILEFRGDKVAHETIYVSEGWPAPDWRAPYRS
jgi:hypothetical protein